jgi:hypothetical protein
MSVQGPTGRRLFDVELPPRLSDMLRIVEGRARQPVGEIRGEQADVGPCVAFFDDTGKPLVAYREKSGAPPLEMLALEVARLWHRGGKLEKYMPYSEMRHAVNQRLCRRLFRIVEEEIIISEVASAGLPVRKYLKERLSELFLEPLQTGKYRASEPDPGRTREGALDALESAVAEYDENTVKRFMVAVAEADAAIARPFGLMYKVIEQHRPFDGDERVKAAYYLAVPFLFDARKPTTPITQVKGRVQ